VTTGFGQRRRRRGRAPLAAVAGLVLAVGVAAGLVTRSLQARSAARTAFPTADGRLAVRGLAARLEIFRDRHGVPHVEAASEADALFGLGFAHAQDRLAQMLWLVRTARGRSAEVAGPAQLPADRLARVLDLGGLAEADYARLGPGPRRLLDAYTRGVNARIERLRRGLATLPLALGRLEVPLEDWAPSDSLAILKLYSWGLAGSLDVGLVLADLIEHLGRFGAAPFFPREAGGGPGGRGAVQAGLWPSAGAAAGLVPDPLRRAARLEGRALGSSAWAVAGALTESGLPILAADAHLAPTAPPYFYVAHLRGGEFDVAGATIPGLPLFWTGANRRVAWATTHARAVTTDLYEETLHETDPGLYHDGKGWQALAERVERIRVRGGAEETLRVQTTRHGPLIHGLVGPGRRPLSIAWAGAAAEGEGSVEALFGVARARSAEELVKALARHGEPPIAVVYVDAEGSLGLQVAGWIPRRQIPESLVPLPGRARVYEWAGPVAYQDLPRLRRERGGGWVIAADNPLAQGEGPPIEWLWRSGERAARIDELLRAESERGPLSLRQVARLQTDVGSPRALELLARVDELAGSAEPLSGEAREVLSLLRDWDGRAGAWSVGSAAYHVYLERLTEKLLEEVLGEPLMRRYLALPQADPEAVVLEMLTAASAGATEGTWLDPAAVAEAARSCLRETWFQLSFRLGPNRGKWSWGRLHPLRFEPFGPPLRRLAQRAELGPFPYGGDGQTINAAEYLAGDRFAVRVASTFRFAIDASALDEALFSLAPGQSEHPRHPDYAGGIERWLEGRPALLATSPLLVEESSVGRLVLEPPEAGSG
jgi:penicillin amidase